ncbi:MAG TPA: glycosyltransferase family 39 protein, partial [Saprospiraceae bacterium]|nr:glycosyltransferase family 39 protein [Saprospiraceae bacterium]
MSKKIKKQPGKPHQHDLSSLPKWLQSSVQQWIVFAFGLILYANTLGYSFTQDDAIVIQENMFTQQGIKGIPGILEYDTFYGFFKDPTKLKLVSGGRYRPFTLVVFATLHQLFNDTPFVYHFISILLFAFTCMVLYNVLLLLLKTRFSDLQAGFIAFSASLLFAAHPIHTEVVANIKGLDETFSLLGSLAALWFCIKAKESNKLKYAWMGAVCFFIGLLSKENAITYLAVIPLALWYFYSEKGVVRFTMPYLVAVISFLLLRTAVIGVDFGGAPLELMNNPYLKVVGNEYVPFSPSEKLATIFYTLGLYIKLLIFPQPLTHDYYPRHIGIMSFGDVGVLLSFLGYILLAIIAFKGLKTRTLVSFSIFYFLITLSIVSNLFFPIGTNMSERFMFMPSIGFCLLLAYGLNLLANKTSSQMNQSLYQKGIMIAGIILLAYSYKSFSRNTVWKDNYTLFTT